MSNKKSPVYDVKAVPVEKVVANDYNPNIVAPPEMKLLELSIWEDGFTMPCVRYYDWLLYTSDAADDPLWVELGGLRSIDNKRALLEINGVSIIRGVKK